MDLELLPWSDGHHSAQRASGQSISSLSVKEKQSIRTPSFCFVLSGKSAGANDGNSKALAKVAQARKKILENIF